MFKVIHWRVDNGRVTFFDSIQRNENIKSILSLFNSIISGLKNNYSLTENRKQNIRNLKICFRNRTVSEKPHVTL